MLPVYSKFRICELEKSGNAMQKIFTTSISNICICLWANANSGRSTKIGKNQAPSACGGLPSP